MSQSSHYETRHDCPLILRTDRAPYTTSPACRAVGCIDNPCSYCGPARTDARQRLAEMVTALAPATEPARRRMRDLIRWPS
ncbi:MAG: hypothetical protein JWO69_2040 [Thermoleophilia bacterium]|nr:hypothetical protein [Thermoleophilia bacterium]